MIPSFFKINVLQNANKIRLKIGHIPNGNIQEPIADYSGRSKALNTSDVSEVFNYFILLRI
jgi:hypothetical protein